QTGGVVHHHCTRTIDAHGTRIDAIANRHARGWPDEGFGINAEPGAADCQRTTGKAFAHHHERYNGGHRQHPILHRVSTSFLVLSSNTSSGTGPDLWVVSRRDPRTDKPSRAASAELDS